MNWNYILCVGDSLTFGARDEFGSSYPFEMEKILEQEIGGAWICINKSECGLTSSELVKKFFIWCDELICRSQVKECCILIGMNDSKDSVALPSQYFLKNLEHIYKVCCVLRMNLYLATIPKITAGIAPEYSRRSNERIKEFNEVIRRFCREKTEGIFLVELEDLPQDAYSDGVHFSNKGNVEVARRFAKVIANNRVRKGGVR